MKILDACCGSKLFWFDKDNEYTTYMDIREESFEIHGKKVNVTPDVVAAGASTSIFGVFAAITVAGYFGRNPYLKQLGQSYQALIVINLIFNLFMPNVGLVGHIGGLVGGLLVAVFLPTLHEKNMFQAWQRLLAGGVYLLLALGMIFFAL